MLFFIVAALGLASSVTAQSFNLTITSNVDSYGDGDEFDIPLRIVNGVEAQKHEFPFIARLTVIWPNGDAGMCGASLLNQKFVITAAHCFYHPNTNQFAQEVRVYLGDHNIKQSDASRVTASGSQVHLNGYVASSHYNDIAIIELAQPVSYTSAIQAICIDRAGSNHVRQTATAAGWGALGSSKPTSNVLRKVQLPVLGDDVCSRSYGRGYYKDAMICAGYTDGSKDTCQGDSGGPLFLNNNGFTLVGATSFGAGCASRGYPGVYARVSNYNSWIRNTAGRVCER